MLFDDRQHLVDGAVEVIVDHDVVGLGDPHRLLVLGLAQPGEDLVVGVAAAAQPAFLLVARRREHEDQDCVRNLALHLLGAVELDLEHDVGRVGLAQLGRARRAVVIAEELGPLEEPALTFVALERLGGREDVGVRSLARTLRAGGPGPAQPQRRVAGHKGIDDGALAHAPWAGDDDDERVSSQAARAGRHAAAHRAPARAGCRRCRHPS